MYLITVILNSNISLSGLNLNVLLHEDILLIAYKKDAINLSNFRNYYFLLHIKGYNNNIIPITIYYNISLQPLVSLSGTLDNFSVY